MSDQPMFESHKTATGRKRFKRYFTGHDNGKPGKGSWQRDSQISEDTMRIRWCFNWHTTDKHWDHEQERCRTCGTTLEELLTDELVGKELQAQLDV